MKNFYELLDELESLNGSNAKEDQLAFILKHVKNAEVFFRFAFNDQKFGVKEQSFKNAFPEYKNTHEHISDWLGDFEDNHLPSVTTVHSLIILGNDLINISGDMQIARLREWFDNIIPIKKKWFCRAILKDLRCGIQVKTVNSVFRQLGLKSIKKFKMQLCDKLDVYDEDAVKKKIKFPCSMECKYDGIRIQAEVFTEWDGDIEGTQETKVILTSRRGTDRTDSYPEVVEELQERFAGEDVILDGEMTSRSFQSLMTKDDTSSRKYIIFDLLVDEGLKYMNRWDNLKSLLEDKGITAVQDNQIYIGRGNHLFAAEHYSCNNLTELQQYYDDLNKRGEEGIIVKLDDRPYERGSRKHMFKCKKVYTADLKIIGWKYGEGRRSHKVATLCLQDASKTINVDVGSGITDEDCDYLTQELEKCKDIQSDSEVLIKDPSFIGKICEIKYNEITETNSLRFPRFICIRDDKDEPDDLSNDKVRQA